jgi:uncharacterized protein YcbX
MNIESIYRYPVKGLTPEPLAAVSLSPGRCLPWDRAFALVQGDAALDRENPEWMMKTNFMCLLRAAKIARLQARFDEAAGVLRIAEPGGAAVAASPFSAGGRAEIGAFLVGFLGEKARFGAAGEAPGFVYGPGHSFCDHKTQVVSLIGLGSLRALEAAVGGKRDKLRFRANLYVEGAAAWAEFGWVGKVLEIGAARLLVQERIDRCAATKVNPVTAERDVNPVVELQEHFGHIELGVFAEVLQGGGIGVGDAVRVVG